MRRHIYLLLFVGLLSTPAIPSLHAAIKGSHSTSDWRQSESVQEDLGTIREVNDEAFNPVYRARVTAGGAYTTNANLRGDHSSSDLLFQPTLEVGVNVPLGNGFDFDALARLESVIYGEHSSGNFWGASGAFTLSYKPKSSLPRVFIGAEPYWYADFDSDRISSAMGLTAGVDFEKVVNRGYTQLFAGYQFYHYLADPSRDNRNAHQLIAGVTHQFRPALFGQLFYSVRFSHYTNRDRQDIRHAVGGGVIYQFSPDVFGNVTGLFVDNDSNEELWSYQSAGVNFGLTFQF